MKKRTIVEQIMDVATAPLFELDGSDDLFSLNDLEIHFSNAKAVCGLTRGELAALGKLAIGTELEMHGCKFKRVG